MTLSDFDVWAEVTGALLAAAMLPFYMGILHLSLVQLLLYASVAGPMLAIGEQLRRRGIRTFCAADFWGELPMWTALVLGLGLLAYGAALLLI